MPYTIGLGAARGVVCLFVTCCLHLSYIFVTRSLVVVKLAVRGGSFGRKSLPVWRNVLSAACFSCVLCVCRLYYTHIAHMRNRKAKLDL